MWPGGWRSWPVFGRASTTARRRGPDWAANWSCPGRCDIGKREKHNKKYGKNQAIDRTLTAPESEAQRWERRARAAQQLHESRQRAQGAFRRNALVDAAMQHLLSTTEDPRGPLGLATHYQTHCQWQERPQGGLVRYDGTPDYRSSTDEWTEHLQRVLAGWSLDPPPAARREKRERDAQTTDATGGLGGVDTGALGRARVRLLDKEPTLSFVFESCCWAGLTESDVGARLGMHRGNVSKLKWRALRLLQAWVAGHEVEGAA